MCPFGVIECFYGLPWSTKDREDYAVFLKEIGFQFYIYGPKADETLRKNWHVPFTAEQREKFKTMGRLFIGKGLQFGMALSPQGLYNNLDLQHRRKLQDKAKAINDLGVDILGLFFDDMKTAPDMAERQVEIAHLVKAHTSARVIFCPSYYCQDSLLDLMFGDRPPNYLETIGERLDPEIDILWTGEDIISREITTDHLTEVRHKLRRKPFICDNFFANDGPLNCGFLRIQPPTGRERQVFANANGWAFNPMNQAHLSRIALMAAAKYANRGMDPDQALHKAIERLCSVPTAEFLRQHHRRFTEVGLSEISDNEKATLLSMLNDSVGPIEKELALWLNGHYNVGFDAVIDQSCYET